MNSNVKIIIFIAPDHWYDKKSMISFTLENIGQWTMKIRFFNNMAYFFILLSFLLTVDFFPDGEKFCKILYLIVVKKKWCSVNIFRAQNVFFEANKGPVKSLITVGAVFCVATKNYVDWVLVRLGPTSNWPDGCANKLQSYLLCGRKCILSFLQP